MRPKEKKVWGGDGLTLHIYGEFFLRFKSLNSLKLALNYYKTLRDLFEHTNNDILLLRI